MAAVSGSCALSCWTSWAKAAPSKVNSAPRRACAVAGSGMADSWARVRWYPSMGTKAAMGGRLGNWEAWRVLRASVRRLESVVLPGERCVSNGALGREG